VVLESAVILSSMRGGSEWSIYAGYSGMTERTGTVALATILPVNVWDGTASCQLGMNTTTLLWRGPAVCSFES
jgi:hypothetical protein